MSSSGREKENYREGGEITDKKIFSWYNIKTHIFAIIFILGKEEKNDYDNTSGEIEASL